MPTIKDLIDRKTKLLEELEAIEKQILNGQNETTAKIYKWLDKMGFDQDNYLFIADGFGVCIDIESNTDVVVVSISGDDFDVDCENKKPETIIADITDTIIKQVSHRVANARKGLAAFTKKARSDEPKPCPKCKRQPHSFELANEMRYSCCIVTSTGQNTFTLASWNALPREDDKPSEYCQDCGGKITFESDEIIANECQCSKDEPSDELADMPPCPVCGGRCEQGGQGNPRAPYCCENLCTQSDGCAYQTKAEWLALDRSKMPTPERPHQTSEPVADYKPEVDPLEDIKYSVCEKGKNVVSQALALIDGDRQQQYGDYTENAQKIADAWSAMLGINVPAELVPAMFVAVKIIRMRRETDNEVDATGYLIHQARMIMAGTGNWPYDDGADLADDEVDMIDEENKEDGDDNKQ